MSQDVFYEPGLIIAEGDLVAIHGRIRGRTTIPQVVFDLFRIEAVRIAEHWDAMQDELAPSATASGIAMFEPRERDLAPGMLG